MTSESKVPSLGVVTTASPLVSSDGQYPYPDQRDSLSKVSSDHHRSVKRKGSEWEILGNLEKGVSYTIKPKKHQGYLYKRKKWPLKGWHKRYFVIEQGFFTYAKSEADLNRGRTLGRFNIGVSVISANYAEMRIDIDAEESVHHVKLDTMEQFGLFLEQLQQVRSRLMWTIFNQLCCFSTACMCSTRLTPVCQHLPPLPRTVAPPAQPWDPPASPSPDTGTP